jgi:hypothetical protein
VQRIAGCRIAVFTHGSGPERVVGGDEAGQCRQTVTQRLLDASRRKFGQL